MSDFIADLANLHQSLHADQKRLDEEAQVLLRIGFTPAELVMVYYVEYGKQVAHIVPRLMAQGVAP